MQGVCEQLMLTRKTSDQKLLVEGPTLTVLMYCMSSCVCRSLIGVCDVRPNKLQFVTVVVESDQISFVMSKRQ